MCIFRFNIGDVQEDGFMSLHYTSNKPIFLYIANAEASYTHAASEGNCSCMPHTLACHQNALLGH